MKNDCLVKMIKRDCPICNQDHELEKRKRITQALVKGVAVDYEHIYFRCTLSDEEENEFVSAGMMDENLLRARDSYRTDNGLLTSVEIAQIRKDYGLTQSEFSALLGLGEDTIAKYESKLIQDETYDNLMRMVYNDPMFALKCLESNKDKFSNQNFEWIKDRIKNQL